MLDFEKIRLMTSLTVYENENRNKVFKVNNYYKFDYIAGHMAASFVRYSLCFMIVFLVYVFFKADAFFYNINLTGITDILKKIGIWYLIGLVVYLIITLIVYALRYDRARKGILLYSSQLKRLGRKYYSGKREAD